jgi:hypothetical protein
LHVRLLLLRTVLSTFITSEFQDRAGSIPLDNLLSHRVHLQCAIVCVKTALEAINTIRKATAESSIGSNTSSAWWYNVLYLYTSATVLIAARLSSEILADVSEDAVLEAWHTAVHILEQYSAIGASIKRLTTTLRLLSEAVPQQYSRIKSSEQHVRSQTPAVAQSHVQTAMQAAGMATGNTLDATSFPLDGADGTPSGQDFFSADFALDFDTVFDPSDLSWLMTIPLDA